MFKDNYRYQHNLYALHIEQEVTHVAILHDVVFAFDAQFACGFDGGL